MNRGCTATSVSKPAFYIECTVTGNQIVLTNPSFTTTLSESGPIQVVVGITNPSAPVTWTIKGYEFWLPNGAYGLQIMNTVVYTPNVETGTEQSRSQIRMQPFTTKVFSTTHTPFRIAFKLSNSPPSLPDVIDYDAGQSMILRGLDAVALFPNFECLFKEYTLEPTEAPQSPLLNPYRNWKQHTQYIPFYAYCIKSGTDLLIEPPRTRGLSINNYYELVVMPVGAPAVVGASLTVLSQTGFNNLYDSQYRLITIPDSC